MKSLGCIKMFTCLERSQFNFQVDVSLIFSVHCFHIFLIFGLISRLGTVKGRVSLLRTPIFELILEGWVKYSLRLRYYYYQATVKLLFASEESRKLQ